MAIPGVEEVYYTMGDIDFVAISRVQTRDQLNDLIEEIVSIDGVNETSSKFVCYGRVPRYPKCQR